MTKKEKKRNLKDMFRDLKDMTMEEKRKFIDQVYLDMARDMYNAEYIFPNYPAYPKSYKEVGESGKKDYPERVASTEGEE
jgi:hypothetical protein